MLHVWFPLTNGSGSNLPNEKFSMMQMFSAQNEIQYAIKKKIRVFGEKSNLKKVISRAMPVINKPTLKPCPATNKSPRRKRTT